MSQLIPKATRERRTNKPKISRRKEIIKIRAEINKIETKKTIEKINENKNGSLKRSRKLTNPQPDSSREKRRGFKSIKLETKREKLQMAQTNTKDHRDYHKQLYANKVDNL